jgi:hypothetical protein
LARLEFRTPKEFKARVDELREKRKEEGDSGLRVRKAMGREINHILRWFSKKSTKK